MRNNIKKIQKKLTLKKGTFKQEIPQGTVVYLPHSFAGKGSQKVFKKRNNKVQKYGGKAKKWSKYKGYIYVNNYLIELHWITHPIKGSYEYKIKNYKRLQSKSFFYDFLEELQEKKV